MLEAFFLLNVGLNVLLLIVQTAYAEFFTLIQLFLQMTFGAAFKVWGGTRDIRKKSGAPC